MGRGRDIVMAGLFSTALHNEPMLAIGIPVEISGEVRYGLYAQVRPQRIAAKRCAGRPCRMAG